MTAKNSRSPKPQVTPTAAPSSPRRPRPIGGSKLSQPLLAIQVVAGLAGERLDPTQEALLIEMLSGQLTAALPGTQLATLGPSVTGHGTIIGVFRGSGTQAQIDQRLLGLGLTGNVFSGNLQIFGSVEMFNSVASGALGALQEEMARSGATLSSIAVTSEVRNGRRDIVTRLRGTITAAIPDIDFVVEVTDKVDQLTLPDSVIQLGDLPPIPQHRLTSIGQVDFEPDTRRAAQAAVLAATAGALLIALTGPVGIAAAIAGGVALLAGGALAAEAALLEGAQLPRASGALGGFVSLVQTQDIQLPKAADGTATRIALSYDDVDITPTGAVISGRMAPMPRRPRVSFITPSALTVMPGERTVQRDFRALLRDVREPLSRSWSTFDGSIGASTGQSARVTYQLPDLDPAQSVVRHLTLTVTDADGFEPSSTKDVVISALDQATLDSLPDNKPDLDHGEQP